MRPAIWFLAAALLCFFGWASAAHAGSFDVTIGTAELSGGDALLAFDLVDGDGATGTLLGLSSLEVVGGSLAGIELSGGASGDPATHAALDDSDFFNELAQSLSLGSSLTFRIDVTSISAPGTPVPDSFSIFLLDPTSGLTLVHTDLPGDALLTFDLVQPLAPVAAGLGEPTSPRLDVTVSAVPEPATASLLLGALAVVVLLSRARGAAGRRALATALALTGLTLSAGAAAQTAVPVDASVTTSIGGLVLDRASGNFVAQVRLTNGSSQTLAAPLSLAVTSFSRAGVTLANASGTDAQGPYVSVPLPQEGMTPGTQLELRLAFANPSRARFTFTTSVRAVPDGGVTLSDDVRTLALDDLAALASSFNGAPAADRLAALSQFVAGRPEFASSGGTAGEFWATFTDGRTVAVLDRKQTAPPAAFSVPIAASEPVAAGSPGGLPGGSSESGATELPGSNQVRLISAMGPNWGDIRNDISGPLTAEKYKPILFSGTVEDMKNIRDDGVLYISSHGSVGPAVPPDPAHPEIHSNVIRYLLWTSTTRSEALDQTYKTELALHRLEYFEANEDADSNVDQVHYAITGDFVEHYWKAFARNSLVFIDACSSESIAATDFREQVMKKGATVYMGWSGSVDDGFSTPTARFMFDRLLGADIRTRCCSLYEATPEPQRPFPWPDVVQDLGNHGLDVEDDGVKLVVSTCKPGCATEFGLLAPSVWISTLGADVTTGLPYDRMYISGVFGEDPGGAATFSSQRAVLIGGKEATIENWSPTMITVDPNATGDGSVGELRVRVRDQLSNGGMLSEWRGLFTTVARGKSSLKATIVHDMRIRADVRKVRSVIHQPPQVVTSIGDTLGTAYSWVCNGSDVVVEGDTTTTTTWTGSTTKHDFPINQSLPVAIDPAGPSLLLFQIPAQPDIDKCTQTIVRKSPQGTSTTTSDLFLSPFIYANNNMRIAIDASSKLVGRTLGPVTTADGTVTLSFPAIENNFPPDPNQPQ
jgi:hypothetical protein